MNILANKGLWQIILTYQSVFHYEQTFQCKQTHWLNPFVASLQRMDKISISK